MMATGLARGKLLAVIGDEVWYLHAYINKSCSAPFMIQTRPMGMVHFSVKTELKH